jgi:hypothetical protein
MSAQGRRLNDTYPGGSFRSYLKNFPFPKPGRGVIKVEKIRKVRIEIIARVLKPSQARSGSMRYLYSRSNSKFKSK